MAAVLCQSIGQLCSGLCKLPCNLVNGCCENVCSALGQTLCSPFFPYLAVTCALNVPPVAWAIQSYTKGECDATWLYVNAIGSLVHILGSFYICRAIQAHHQQATSLPQAEVIAEESGNQGGFATQYKSIDSTSVNAISFKSISLVMGSGDGEGEANSVKRLTHVLCYDKIVAVYIVVAISWLVWQSVGISHVLFRQLEGCDEVERWILISVVLGFLYMMLVCFAFGCSLLCLR
jgi:hypothetical protein